MKRLSKTHVLTIASTATLLVTAAAMSGCEVLVDFDRSQIPGEDAGATDASDATTGDVTIDSTVNPDTGTDTGTDAPPDVGNDAPADTGTDVNVDSGGDAGCTGPSSCPAPGNDCEIATCTAGACGQTHAASGATCASNGGRVCNGTGTCVACLQSSNCPATGTLCATPVCNGTTCGTTNAAKGATCSDSGGTVCDGAGKCVSAHCNDNIQDADESDVDCGGTACATCADGRKCATGADCADKVCSGGPLTCQAPTCSDSVQNGIETDVDCGGSGCPQCADRKHCGANSDCVSAFCFGSGPATCVSCIDGVKDGNETDTDCGGAQCDLQAKTCSVGKACLGNADCTTSPNECVAISCATTCTATNLGTSHVLAVGQTPANCQKLVCNGAGASLSVDDPTDVPAQTTLCNAPSCTGAPLAPIFTPAASGTDCTADNQPPKHLCSSSGTCVQCNAPTDCPPTGNECVIPTCSGNVCGTQNLTQTHVMSTGQTAHDCQKIVCNGSGGTTSADDATDPPLQTTVCNVPSCAGAPLAPTFTPAATGTSCTADGNPMNTVCGDTTTGASGTCVQCNVLADCAAQFPAATMCTTNMCL